MGLLSSVMAAMIPSVYAPLFGEVTVDPRLEEGFVFSFGLIDNFVMMAALVDDPSPCPLSLLFGPLDDAVGPCRWAPRIILGITVNLQYSLYTLHTLL